MQGIGPGDRFIAELLRRPAQRGMPVTIAANKVDRADQGQAHGGDPRRTRRQLGLGGEIFPISSARTGAGVDGADRPPGLAAAAPARCTSTQPTSTPISRSVGSLLAELVREQVLARTREEVPHAVEVEVSEITHASCDVVRIHGVRCSPRPSPRRES